MWYTLFFLAGAYALHRVFAFIPTNGIETAVNQFLLLGIIPGTDIAITFNWFIVGFWVTFFYWLLTKVSFGTLKKIRARQYLARIERISL